MVQYRDIIYEYPRKRNASGEIFREKLLMERCETFAQASPMEKSYIISVRATQYPPESPMLPQEKAKNLKKL